MDFAGRRAHLWVVVGGYMKSLELASGKMEDIISISKVLKSSKKQASK